MNISVLVANESHTKFAQAICDEILLSAKERGTGIAKRTPEYVSEKMRAGKAVIAVTDDGTADGKLLIGHYSSKYPDLSVFLDEARTVFAESYLTHDLDVVDLPLKKL